MRSGRRAARTDDVIDFTAGMMILRVSPQAPRVAIRLAASFGFALVRLFISMCQHVSIPVQSKRFDLLVSKA